MEKSKTFMEIFEELYPPEEIADKPFKIAEAIGYINCLEHFVPSISKELHDTKIALLCAIAFRMI